jgi:hypothetical protein
MDPSIDDMETPDGRHVPLIRAEPAEQLESGRLSRSTSRRPWPRKSSRFSPWGERFRMAIVGQLCGRLERGEEPFAVAVPQREDD